MSSQDGNKVYLKPPVVEKISSGDLRAIQVFFREQHVPNFRWFFFFDDYSEQ